MKPVLGPSSGGRSRRLVVGCLLAVGSVAVALLVSEIGLRLFPSLLPPEAELRLHWRTLRSSETVPDDRIGFLYRRNFSGSRDVGDFSFTFHTDAQGFRNPDPWPETADVVLLGDSWVFGWGVDDDRAWVDVARRLVPGVRLLNLGLVGASPAQYEALYEDYGAPRSPRLVVMGLFPGNDIDDDEIFHSWQENPRGLSLKDWRASGGGAASTGIGRLAEGSYLLALVRAVREAPSPFGSQRLDFPSGARLRFVPRMYARVEQQIREGRPPFLETIRAVERLRDRVEADGAELVVLLFPTKEEVHLPLRDIPSPVLTPGVAAELERRGISAIDVTPVLQGRARDEALFFEVDGHMNVDGNRLLGEWFAEWLSTRGASLGRPRSEGTAPSKDSGGPHS